MPRVSHVIRRFRAGETSDAAFDCYELYRGGADEPFDVVSNAAFKRLALHVQWEEPHKEGPCGSQLGTVFAASARR